MSVEQSSVIDAIGIDPKSGKVHLTISDHLPWSGGHLLTLQEKLNSYLAFLESGQVYSDYPQAKTREFVIELVSQYRPDEAAQSFLAQAKSLIENAGFSFSLRPLSGGYADDAA